MRVLHLRDRARDACHALAPRGTPERAALARVLRDFTDDRVPLVGPGDRSVTYGSSIMGRPVAGTDLVVYYVPAGDDVFVVDVVRSP